MVKLRAIPASCLMRDDFDQSMECGWIKKCRHSKGYLMIKGNEDLNFAPKEELQMIIQAANSYKEVHYDDLSPEWKKTVDEQYKEWNRVALRDIILEKSYN
jgi:hypothetical protein